jgi:hypothetical protein
LRAASTSRSSTAFENNCPEEEGLALLSLQQGHFHAPTS